MIIIKLKTDAFAYKTFDYAKLYKAPKDSNQSVIATHLTQIVWEYFEDLSELPRGSYDNECPLNQQNVTHFLFQRETHLHKNRHVSNILVLSNNKRRYCITEHVVLCVPCFTQKYILAKSNLWSF